MIVITGATGTVGTALLHELAAMDVPAHVLARDPSKVTPGGFEVVRGAFEDGAALRQALEGAQRLFLLSPPGTASMVRAQVAVVDAAREAGVRHVVKLSSIGADEAGAEAGIIRAHRQVERHIEDSGLAYTHLRPHWFQQNELGQAQSIAQDGRFYAPDVTRITAIDARDIGAVAARVLTQEGHEGRSYVLTGPEALGYDDVAAVLAEVLGRPVEWVPVGLDDARASMLEAGLPEELAVGFTEIMARYRDGGVTAAVSPAVEAILGRPPRSFGAFVRDHRDAFGRLAAAA